MHIPDGFLDPKMSGGLLGAALAALAYCFAKVAKAVSAPVPQRVLAAAGNALGNLKLSARRALTEEGELKLRRMAEAAAWVFAAQMFNFPIGGGTSGHLLGGVFAAALVGPYAGALVLAGVLAVQAALFGDGGLAALGANIINMAGAGALAGGGLYLLLKKSFSETFSVAVAAWCSVMLAALLCSFELGFSGTVGIGAAVRAMLGAHALIGLAEAGLTVALLNIFRKMDKR